MTFRLSGRLLVLSLSMRFSLDLLVSLILFYFFFFLQLPEKCPGDFNKPSPLALLAATCNKIGGPDPGVSKPAVPAQQTAPRPLLQAERVPGYYHQTHHSPNAVLGSSVISSPRHGVNPAQPARCELPPTPPAEPFPGCMPTVLPHYPAGATTVCPHSVAAAAAYFNAFHPPASTCHMALPQLSGNWRKKKK